MLLFKTEHLIDAGREVSERETCFTVVLQMLRLDQQRTLFADSATRTKRITTLKGLYCPELSSAQVSTRKPTDQMSLKI